MTGRRRARGRALVAGVALVATLAGCSSTASGQPTPAGQATPTGPATSAATSPPTASSPPSGSAADTVRVAAAGDIACRPSSSGFQDGLGTPDRCRQQATSDLLVRLRDEGGLAAVLPLGDTQYETGTAEEFRASYERSWGRLKSITRPAIGNHEDNSGGAGYFAYFGDRAGPPHGYYSYDLGAWHLIALNSNCSSVGGCDASSPQGRWLTQDLAAHPNRCTLAYYHHPRWSDGPHGDSDEVAPLVEALYAAGVEIVLNGHDHDYQRFPPRAPDGSVDEARGIRQFVVGTGGKGHYDVRSPTEGSVWNDDTFGVLLLSLGPDGYAWQFVPEAGRTFSDTGQASCH